MEDNQCSIEAELKAAVAAKNLPELKAVLIRCSESDFHMLSNITASIARMVVSEPAFIGKKALYENMMKAGLKRMLKLHNKNIHSQHVWPVVILEAIEGYWLPENIRRILNRRDSEGQPLFCFLVGLTPPQQIKLTYPNVSSVIDSVKNSSALVLSKIQRLKPLPEDITVKQLLEIVNIRLITARALLNILIETTQFETKHSKSFFENILFPLLEVLIKKKLIQMSIVKGQMYNKCSGYGCDGKDHFFEFVKWQRKKSEQLLGLRDFRPTTLLSCQDRNDIRLVAQNMFFLRRELKSIKKEANSLDSLGRLPLVHAVWLRKPNDVKELLEKGADPEQEDPRGYKALFLAVERGYSEIFCILLAAGAKVNEPDHDGLTPLFYAVQFARLSAARELIAYGADVKFCSHSPASRLELFARVHSEQHFDHKILERMQKFLAGRTGEVNVSVLDFAEIFKGKDSEIYRELYKVFHKKTAAALLGVHSKKAQQKKTLIDLLFGSFLII